MGRRGATLAAVTAVGVLASGCWGGGGVWDDRIAALPAAPEDTHSVVFLADIAAAAELAGVEELTHDGLLDLLRPSSEVGLVLPEVLDAQRYGEAGEFVEVTGFERTDVDWAVELWAPPRQFAVLGGRFDPDTLDTANTRSGEDTWNTEGDPMTVDPQRSGPGRPLGREPHLRLDGDRLHLHTAAPEQLATVDDAPDLGRDDRVATLVGILDELDSYSAVLELAGPGGLVDDHPNPDLESLPAPFTAVGAGAVPADQATVVLIHVHDEATSAERNAEALEAALADGGSPLAERYEVVDIDVRDTAVITQLELVGDLSLTSFPGLLFRGPFGRHAP